MRFPKNILWIKIWIDTFLVNRLTNFLDFELMSPLIGWSEDFVYVSLELWSDPMGSNFFLNFYCPLFTWLAVFVNKSPRINSRVYLLFISFRIRDLSRCSDFLLPNILLFSLAIKVTDWNISFFISITPITRILSEKRPITPKRDCCYNHSV